MPALPMTLLVLLWLVGGESDDGGSTRTMTKSRVPLVGEVVMLWRYFDVCSISV